MHCKSFTPCVNLIHAQPWSFLSAFIPQHKEYPILTLQNGNKIFLCAQLMCPRVNLVKKEKYQMVLSVVVLDHGIGEKRKKKTVSLPAMKKDF